VGARKRKKGAPTPLIQLRRIKRRKPERTPRKGGGGIGFKEEMEKRKKRLRKARTIRPREEKGVKKKGGNQNF